METLNSSLKWRYATKKFDSSKTVDQSKIDLLKETIQLSASSYGLQPYKVLIVENKELKSELRPVSWNQPQIEECSHLMVFCRVNEFNNNHIDTYLDNICKTRSIEEASVKAYGDFMKGTISKLSDDQKRNWIDKQIYIALGKALAGCADLKLDSCPLEGIESSKYDDILNLNDKGISTVVALAVGYRSTEDINQNLKKVRKPMNELFETI